MADLPKETLSQEPPFTYCGIDMFCSILAKEGHKEMKRYGCLFTCLSSSTIHIEFITSLYTDGFIQALRRFVLRKGNARVIRTDNGTNFAGASAELSKTFSEMNHKKMRSCWSMDVNGSCGKGILLLFAIWEECGSAK